MENYLGSFHISPTHQNFCKPSLKIFDLDRTLITATSGSRYLPILYQNKVLSFPTFLQAVFLRLCFGIFPMTVEELHQKAFQLLKGLSLDDLEKHVDLLVEKLLPHFIYPPAYQELLAAQQSGDTVVLLSSSPDFIVQKFAAYFKIPQWESTVYGIDKDNRICKIAKWMMGQQKERCLLELQEELKIPKSQVVVYTDSYDDLPLLLRAGEPVAVNPDRKLAKIARLNRWRTI